VARAFVKQKVEQLWGKPTGRKQMPFIQGRYHINPIAGAALEAAREAEDALTALHGGEQEGDAKSAGERKSTGVASTKTPIHRVEIEAAEVVPSHSGRAQRGFVARIHRASGVAVPDGTSQAGRAIAAVPSVNQQSSSIRHGGTAGPSPETHVFANHEDLTDFLRGEFAKDSDR
jgi:hypothetical protein